MLRLLESLALLALLHAALLLAPSHAALAQARVPVVRPSGAPTHRVLTLDEALVIALGNNPQVAQASKEAEAARAAVGVAGAGYWPTLDLRLNQNRSVSGSGGGGNSVQGVIAGTVSRTLYQGQLTLNQTIYDFNRRTFQLGAAEQQFMAALQNLEQTRQDVVLTLREQFFRTHTAEEVLEIRRRTVAAREQRLRQAQGFYEAGLRARIEVTKAEADLAQARLEAVQAETDLQIAWVNLNVAMGLPRDLAYDLQLASLDDSPPRVDTEMMMEAAWVLRPELQSLKARTIAAYNRMEFWYRDRLPTFAGTATYGYSGQQFPLTDTWSLGFSVAWNLFDGFSDQWQARQAKADAEALVQLTNQTRLTVYQAVQSTWLDLLRGHSQIAAARASVKSARENYDLARQRYEVGLGSNLEYTDAQVLLIQAEVNLVTAENVLRSARARLERAIGIYDLDGLVEASREQGARSRGPMGGSSQEGPK